jgi:MFS family permease
VEQVGLFFTMAAIAPMLFQLFGGWLSDSIGRLQAIAIGSMGGALSYLFYILAPTWIWLLPASILTAMAVAFVAPSFQAFVAEESTEKTRGRVYGITSTMFMVVNIVGPLVGGLVAQGLSFRAMYITAGALYGTAAVIRVLMARHASRKSRERGAPPEKPSLTGFRKSLAAVLGLLLAGGVVTWIFVSDGVRDVAFSLTGRLMPLYLENEMGLGLLQISALQSITAVVAMLFMSERVSLVGGFGIMSIGWAVFLGGSNFWHFVLSRAVIGVGWALIDPAYSSLISKAVPDRIRGMAFGLFATSLGLISLPAPWIGARLWESVSPIFPFYVPLVAMLAMLPVMWIKFKLPPDTGEAIGVVAEASAAADAKPAGS